MAFDILKLYQTLSGKPGGRWLFSRAVCTKAPYFKSIRPLFESLEPGRAVVSMKNRHAVHNHIGTVHAIAMCNMAELAGGTCTDVSIPKSHRWIPKGMTVEYLKKAATDLTAEALVDQDRDWSQPTDLPAVVTVRDTGGEAVFRATINMWVTPKKA